MAKGTIDSFSVTAADGGWTVSYTIKTPKPLSSKTFDNCSYDYKNEVFTDRTKLATRLDELIDLSSKGEEATPEAGEDYDKDGK